jgi:integrase
MRTKSESDISIRRMARCPDPAPIEPPAYHAFPSARGAGSATPMPVAVKTMSPPQKKGKTPVLDREEARALLAAIDTSSLTGLRDRAFIGVMIYTFARVGAVVQMDVKDYFSQGQTGHAAPRGVSYRHGQERRDLVAARPQPQLSFCPSNHWPLRTTSGQLWRGGRQLKGPVNWRIPRKPADNA